MLRIQNGEGKPGSCSWIGFHALMDRARTALLSAQFVSQRAAVVFMALPDQLLRERAAF